LDRSIYPPSVRDGGSPPSYLGRDPTIPPQPHPLALQPGANKVNSYPLGQGQPQVDTTTRSTYTSSTHAHPDHPPTHPDRPRRRLDHPPKHLDPLRIHPDSASLRAYLTLHPDSGELRSLLGRSAPACKPPTGLYGPLAQPDTHAKARTQTPHTATGSGSGTPFPSLPVHTAAATRRARPTATHTHHLAQLPHSPKIARKIPGQLDDKHPATCTPQGKFCYHPPTAPAAPEPQPRTKSQP